MGEQFSKDTYVVYGKVGVCRVLDCRELSFDGSGRAGEYYVLSPRSDPRSLVYVPCDNPTLMARLRLLMTKEEIDAALTDISSDSVQWIEDKNERISSFRNLMAQNDHRRILLLVRCLLEKRQERQAAGKKLSVPDEGILQESMRLVEEEFSVVLQIPRSKVPEYIREKIETTD